MRNLSIALTATLAIALQIKDEETQGTYQEGFDAGYERAQNYQSGYEDGFAAGQTAAEEEAQSSNPANALSTVKYIWTEDDSGAETCEKSTTVVLLDEGLTLDPIVTTTDGDACCSSGIDAGLTRPLINACEQTTTLTFTGG